MCNFSYPAPRKYTTNNCLSTRSPKAGCSPDRTWSSDRLCKQGETVVCPWWTWCGTEWCAQFRVRWGMLYVCIVITV